ncbi:hypothetical protein C8R45DRAFT_329308 [Mycena sanguinolenta]|nr:hypothetical protein C8R45DRAFT_329308 [Mycena sanguinolenta]
MEPIPTSWIKSEETESPMGFATSSYLAPVVSGMRRPAASTDSSSARSPALDFEGSLSPCGELNPADFGADTQNHHSPTTNASERSTSRLREDFTQILRLQDGHTSPTPGSRFTSPSNTSRSEGQSGLFFRPIVSTEAHRRASAARRKNTPRFFCELCGAGFTAKHNLQNHMNSHNSIKDFACPSCGRGFTTKHVLSRHQRKCNGASSVTMSASSSVSAIGRAAGIGGGARHNSRGLSEDGREGTPWILSPKVHDNPLAVSVTSSVSAIGGPVGIGGGSEHSSQAVETLQWGSSEEGGEGILSPLSPLIGFDYY